MLARRDDIVVAAIDTLPPLSATDIVARRRVADIRERNARAIADGQLIRYCHIMMIRAIRHRRHCHRRHFCRDMPIHTRHYLMPAGRRDVAARYVTDDDAAIIELRESYAIIIDEAILLNAVGVVGSYAILPSGCYAADGDYGCFTWMVTLLLITPVLMPVVIYCGLASVDEITIVG